MDPRAPSVRKKLVTARARIWATAICAIVNIAFGLTQRKEVTCVRHQCCCGTLLCLRHHVCSGNGISRLLGLYEPGGWRSADLVIVVLALVGFAALGSVPWIVTTPVADDGEEKVAARPGELWLWESS